MAREYPEAPLVGIAVVVWQGERALLVRRAREPNRGRWAFPGGLLELGETLEAAARREVREECGVEIGAPRIVTSNEFIESDETGRVRYHYVLLIFEADWAAGTARAGDDAAALGWVGLADLADLPLAANVGQAFERAWRRRQRADHARDS